MKVAIVIGALGLGAGALLFVWTLWGQWRIEHRFPPVGSFIEVDGQRLHYTDHGRGLPLLLVHGANSNLRDFEASIVPDLAPHFRVLSFDRPGYGYSERADGDWQDPARLADLLLSAAEALGAERPIIVGHSWGGAVVMAAAVRHAGRIRGGVLLAGVAGHWVGSLGTTYALGRLPVVRELMAYSVVYPVGQRVLPAAVGAVSAPNPVAPDYIDAIAAPLALRPASFLSNVEDMARLSEYLQVLSREYGDIDVPLLAIHGQADELVPFWNHGRRLAYAKPDLEVELIEGVGHTPHHASGVRVVSRIRDFAQATADVSMRSGRVVPTPATGRQ